MHAPADGTPVYSMPRDPLHQRLVALMMPTLTDMGFALVRVVVSGKQQKRLQVMAEPADGTLMTVDHCAEISHALSALLDVEDPIEGAYTLEVSSPGLDRPLTRARDFADYAGHEVKVELIHALDGQRRFTGRLLGLEEEAVVLDTETGRHALPLGTVSRARLVLTDALLAAATTAATGQEP